MLIERLAVVVGGRVIHRVDHQLFGDQRHAIAHRPARTRELGVGVEHVDRLDLLLVAGDLHVVERHAPRKIFLQAEHLPVQELGHGDDKSSGSNPVG
jgi:hypothetical protein